MCIRDEIKKTNLIIREHNLTLIVSHTKSVFAIFKTNSKLNEGKNKQQQQMHRKKKEKGEEEREGEKAVMGKGEEGRETEKGERKKKQQ